MKPNLTWNVLYLQKSAVLPNWIKGQQLYVRCPRFLCQGQDIPSMRNEGIDFADVVEMLFDNINGLWPFWRASNFHFCKITIHKGGINQFAMSPYSRGVPNYIIRCWDGKNKISIIDLFSKWCSVRSRDEWSWTRSNHIKNSHCQRYCSIFKVKASQY